jgi:ketosteroid isomerase-like protein
MTDTLDIARRFTAAFNSRDVCRVVSCFTPDATYHDLFYGRFDGRPALTRMFERMYAEGDHHEWTMTNVVTGTGRTVGEWNFTFRVSSLVPRSAGRTLSFRGVSVFETEHGLCAGYHEYFDRGAALLALGISPATVARITARRASVSLAEPGGTSSPGQPA